MPAKDFVPFSKAKFSECFTSAFRLFPLFTAFFVQKQGHEYQPTEYIESG